MSDQFIPLFEEYSCTRQPDLFDGVENRKTYLFDLETLKEIEHSFEISNEFLKEVLNENYTSNELNFMFKTWINRLIKKHPKSFKKNNVPLQTTDKHQRKEVVLNALLTVFTEPTVFFDFFNNLPYGVQSVFAYLIWNNRLISRVEIKNLIGFDIFVKNARYEPVKLINEYSFFQHEHFHAYSYRDTEHDIFCFLDYDISMHLQPFFKPPSSYNLHPVKKPDQSYQIYENNGKILSELPYLISYVNNGPVKVGKNGRPLISTKKDFQTLSQTPEFYPDEKNLNFIRTELLFELLTSCFNGKNQDDPLVTLKDIMKEYCTLNSYDHLGVILRHIKGVSKYLSRFPAYEEVNQFVWDHLLLSLPEDQWVSFNNIFEYLIVHQIPLNFIDFRYSYRDLYYVSDSTTRYDFENKYIEIFNYYTTLIQPFIAGSYFLFASCGLVDIAYKNPTNQQIQVSNEPYLSIFDGLGYVKLSELGAYLTGKSKKYEHGLTIHKETTVTLDKRRLILMMFGDDPLKKIYLERLAKQISPGRYKMTYNQFLKDCTTKEHVKAKVELFKESIEPNLPLIWEDFFNKAIARVNPLKRRNNISVYQVDSDSEFLHLLVNDPILKKLILKVENKQVAITKQDLNLVIKRLATLGYQIS